MTRTDAPAVSDTALRRITIAVISATIILTAIAFWLSYAHLHDVAQRYGLDGIRAWAWPATVDLFIAIGEALILRAVLRHVRDWSAIGLAFAGSVGSIALNVAGVGSHAAGMTYVVAAVPPFAALLAFAALMRQLLEALGVQKRTTLAVQPAMVHETVLDRSAEARAAVVDRPLDRAVDHPETAAVMDRAEAMDRTAVTVQEPDGPRTAPGPDRQVRLDKPARTTRTANADRTETPARTTGPDRTTADLELTDIEQKAVDLLLAADRSISKRSIAEAVRTDLKQSISSDRAAEIARHFRTLKAA